MIDLQQHGRFGIERRIVVGFIVSTEYIQKLLPIWNQRYVEASPAGTIIRWCITYYEKYNQAPREAIQDIYFTESRKKTTDQKILEELGEVILPSLSAEFERSPKMFNLEYLLDQTLDYFRERRMELHQTEVDSLMSDNKIEEAEELTRKFNSQPLLGKERFGVDLGSDENLEQIKKMFDRESYSVIECPGVFGRFINKTLIRGGFVSFLAPEKRGKSFWLLELAIRALHNNANVVFFQAGDMTEEQQLARICSYITRKTVTEEQEKVLYTYHPIRDCFLNQIGTCDKPEREGDESLFPESEGDGVGYRLSSGDLNLRDHPVPDDYVPCRNCYEGRIRYGTVFLEKRELEILTADEAVKEVRRFFSKYKKRFKLSTHLNNSLTPHRVRELLYMWEREDGFVPDVVVIDYADLLIQNSRDDFRHRVDAIWKDLRAISQEWHCLVLTATQADAKSYEKDYITLSNFSEDKRKYSHVTAMYGLNQDKNGIEKRMKVMRINKLLSREEDYSSMDQVYVLQNLDIARAYLGSYLKKH